MSRYKFLTLWTMKRCSNGFILLVIVCALAHHCVARSPQAKPTSGKETSKINSAPQNKNALQPNPNLSPEQVINILLEALQRNDDPAPNSGIATAFRFASPGNRAETGPLDRFVRLVRSPAYKPMLNHKSALRGSVRISGNVARQRITLVAANGERIVYLFTLSKQTEEPYKNCWMTDGVERLRDDENDGQQVAKSNGKQFSVLSLQF